MKSQNGNEVADLLSKKRMSLFCIAFVICGMAADWLYPRWAWSLLLLGVMIWAFSADGLLWLARHPNSMPADYYRRKFWWAHVFDWEFNFGKSNAKGDKS